MRKYKKYVLGYDRDDQCIYGEDLANNMDEVYSTHFNTNIDPIGIKEAKKKHKEMVENNEYYNHPKIVIYELVPIKVEDK